MLAIRYIFVAAFVFNLLVLGDHWLGGARFLKGWPLPTLTEMALTAMVIVLTAKRNVTVYVNANRNGLWLEREHVEV